MMGDSDDDECMSESEISDEDDGSIEDLGEYNG